MHYSYNRSQGFGMMIYDFDLDGANSRNGLVPLSNMRTQARVFAWSMYEVSRNKDSLTLVCISSGYQLGLIAFCKASVCVINRRY